MTVYLDLEDVLSAAVAALAPAEVSVRDIGLVESAIARPRASAFGEDAYPDLLIKAAALLESLARNHPLIDGNKRLAWVSMRLFLVLNASDVRVPSPQIGDDFVREVEQGTSRSRRSRRRSSAGSPSGPCRALPRGHPDLRRGGRGSRRWRSGPSARARR